MLSPATSKIERGRTVAEALRFLRRKPHTIVLSAPNGCGGLVTLRLSAGALYGALVCRGIARGDDLLSEFCGGFLCVGERVAIALAATP
jgi:hypothetical protein